MKKKMISLVFAAAFVMQVVLPAAAEEDLLESETAVGEEYMETGELDDSESGNVDEQDRNKVSDEDISQDLEDTNETESVFEEFEMPDEPAATNLLNEELLDDDLFSEEDILIIDEELQMEAELIEEDISGSETGLLESGNAAELWVTGLCRNLTAKTTCPLALRFILPLSCQYKPQWAATLQGAAGGNPAESQSRSPPVSERPFLNAERNFRFP